MSLNFYSSGAYGLHIFTTKIINEQWLKFLCGGFSIVLFEYLKRQMKTKLYTDSDLILQQINEKS